VVVGEEVLALTIRPPRTTWFHPSPRSIYSAEGPARLAFGVGRLLVAVLLRLCSGARFTKAAFASFHFTQPR
jgi:hypothetical protein